MADCSSPPARSRPSLSIPATFQEDVLLTLECQICYEIAVPPINNCMQGHIVCGFCRKTVERCMICYDQLTAERSYAIEALVGLLKVKCRNSACPELVKVSQLQEHLGSCEFRSIACKGYVQKECKGDLIPFKEYFAHFRDKHSCRNYCFKTQASNRPIRICIQELLAETRDLRWQPYFIVQHGIEFLFHRECEGKIQYFWMTSMLSEADASKYRATLKISSGTTKEKATGQSSSVEWNLTVHSVHITWDKLSKTPDLVQIPVDALIPFGFMIQQNLYLDINCTISNQ